MSWEQNGNAWVKKQRLRLRLLALAIALASISGIGFAYLMLAISARFSAIDDSNQMSGLVLVMRGFGAGFPILFLLLAFLSYRREYRIYRLEPIWPAPQNLIQLL